MIVVDKDRRNPRYLINENAISFTENYQGVNQKGKPIYDVVAVSIVSNAAIMVYDENNGIGYGNDLQYQRWHLNGVTTGLVSAEAHNIYARLSRGDKKEADIIFSIRDYNTDGSFVQESGERTDPSDSHYYIPIGTLTALADANAAPTRTLTFDPGYLSSQKSNNEQGGGWIAKMFDLVVEGEELIFANLRFKDLSVKGEALFSSIASFFSGLRLGDNKPLVSVATGSEADEDSDNAIATPAYVKAFSEGRYLRRDTQDPQSVSGPVTFEQDVAVKGNQSVNGNQSIQGAQSVQGQATFHDGARGDGYVEQGDIIQGWNIDKDGIASFAKVKTPSMQVYELTLNRKTAVQGEFVFSDGEVVENVKSLGADTFLLTVRALYEGYVTTFKVNDILYSNINIIGSSAKTGKCWMYVTEVDGNKITAVHYPYEECPAGENINPVPYMTITRHGNRDDKTRQDLFIISSETSSLTMLRGVNAPIVRSEGLYGVVVGKLPATLLEYINKSGHEYVNGKDPYVYARGVIVQDLIMLDYQGQPIPTEAYRGEWQAKTKYYNKGNVYDSVTHQGSLWQCLAAETTEEPSDNSKDWRKKVSKGDDGDMPTIFTITSSLTSIHQDSSGKLNTNILDIWVNAVGAPSNFEIKDQATLDAYGLSVWFNIDEQEDVRTKLIIGGADAIEVEEGGTIIVAEEDDDDGGAYITLESESIDISSVQSKINIYLVRDADENGFGVDENRMYIPVMRDGQRGRMLYPAGVYDDTREYKIENNSAPFVKEGSTYYVLVWEGGPVKGIQPSKDSQWTYWRQFTYMKYLFAEFLMANNALLGGDNGAVFYDKWLYSQMGMVRGEEGYYSEAKQPIFDYKGDFNGNFYPNAAINWKTGEAAFNNLREVYTRCDKCFYIDMDKLGKYNIIIEPQLTDSKNGSVTRFRGAGPLVILPQDTQPVWQRQGARVSIVAQFSEEYLNSYLPSYNANEKDRGTKYRASAFAIIAADSLFDKFGMSDDLLASNWIINNGYRSKFILLGAGDTVNLRLVVNEHNGKTYNYWYVEASGLTRMDANIHRIDNTVGVALEESINKNDYDEEVVSTKKYKYYVTKNENWGAIDSHTPTNVGLCLFASQSAHDIDMTGLGYDIRNILLSSRRPKDGGTMGGLESGVFFRMLDCNVDGDSNFDTDKAETTSETNLINEEI